MDDDQARALLKDGAVPGTEGLLAETGAAGSEDRAEAERRAT